MNVASLHRNVIRDIAAVVDAVDVAFPPCMPKRYETVRMNLPAFVRRLNVALEPYGIFNQILPDPMMPRGEVVTAGLWISEDDLPSDGSSADVRVLWHPHPHGLLVNMTPQIWIRRRYVFWARLFHELVHRYQIRESETRVFRARGVDTKEDIAEQEYHGNFDEIEAYAAEAAIEFLYWWKGKTFAEAKEAAMAYEGRLVPTYKCYMLMFDKGHPALTHFHRKLVAWYKEMQRQPEVYARLMLPTLA